MSKPNHLPAVVPVRGDALTTTPGTQHIATRMADDLLAMMAHQPRGYCRPALCAVVLSGALQIKF